MSCKTDGIHKDMWTPPTENDIPPWVFAKGECTLADQRMKCIIGPAGTTRIGPVMKTGKAGNTHDTLEWAFVYARWCWRGLGTRPYVDNMLEIFDVLCILTASTLKIETVSSASRRDLSQLVLYSVCLELSGICVSGHIKNCQDLSCLLVTF